MRDVLALNACGSKTCTGHTDLALMPGYADGLVDMPSDPEIDASNAAALAERERIVAARRARVAIAPSPPTDEARRLAWPELAGHPATEHVG